MKFLLPIIIFSVSLLTISFSTKKLKHETKKDQKGFAIVELFTSEGCSSCPPADAALEEIQKKYSDKNVLVVGYHVDYWDKLGWKDTFSDPLFTERQEYYSELFHLNSIYTPQAIINGKKEFVGSNKSKIISSIDDELKNGTDIAIKLKAEKDNSGKINIHYTVDQAIFKNKELVILLVQKEATNKIGKGENEGATLHHINIVRKFSERPISSKEEKMLFDIPSGLKKEDLFIAAFIQNKNSGKISSFQSGQIN